MIAAWMLYCVALGLLLIFAALPVERFVNAVKGPTRRVWALALAGALLLPTLALVVKDEPPAFEYRNLVVATTPASGAVMDGVATLAALDSVLAWAWLVGSLALAGGLVLCLALTAYRGRGWTRSTLDGVPVLLSEDVGPAVVGLFRSRIVLPRWVLDADASARSMILRHEQEHLRAGDPRLLFFAAMILVAMPWNPAAWVMMHRLRLAIEVDCDRRVVHGGALDLRRYAELLLSVGARRGAPAYGVGFSVGRPFLEQRIDRMTLPAPRRRRLQAVVLLLGVVGVLCLAWAVPQPVRAAAVSLDFDACIDDPSQVTRTLLTAFDWSS